ncbi:MAG: glycosyltransferase family 4 protein [Planctomycetes bacterium]|nr:glycosyltransferase family 4 protein [Planctomycetota bacterium]
MRIAIDARKLQDFGIGTYIRNLLHQLARLDQATEYILLCRGQDAGLAQQLGANFRSVVEPARPYSVSEQFRIPIALIHEHVDLFHAPHYVLPPLVPCRSVVTIHDCIHLMFPQYLPNRLAYTYARASIWAATRRADRILTVSESSKSDILRCFNVPADKIVVTYNAIDERFLTEPAEADMVRARERYQLTNPFILYVGNIKPHKNLERLIEAFTQVRRQGFDQLTLVIIGDQISKYQSLRRAVHQHKLHKHVRFLGFVAPETLSALYRLARVFVFPSLYEGFGLPPLEAMASGTPVLSSNVSSLPEVLGEAALLVDPYSADAIAEGIVRLLTDEALRATLKARGLARVRLYSWEESVRRVREVYDEVMLEDRIGAVHD